MLSRRVFSRRKAIVGGVAALVTALAKPVLATPGYIYYRRVAFHNLNTAESLDAVYWANDYYIPQSLKRIDWVLRDFHVNATHAIDKKLLDLLFALQRRLNTDEPFQVTSGYRSPKTNARLVKLNEGGAAHSLHMKGMAVDVFLKERSIGDLHSAAIAAGAGGVGYYPSHGFIHLDVGPVRQWSENG
ncbi:MAG TPA: DUF882 domain-containing protein [Stellaceae bacterium]|nr:DUF882 domain-containing protein [Stellaceae bacterium]